MNRTLLIWTLIMHALKPMHAFINPFEIFGLKRNFGKAIDVANPSSPVITLTQAQIDLLPPIPPDVYEDSHLTAV